MTAEGEGLGAIARRVIDPNRFTTVGAADEEGVRWVSPVRYAPAEDRESFRLSDPYAKHSSNIAARPRRASCLGATTSGPKRCRDRHAASSRSEHRFNPFSGRLPTEFGC